MVCYPGCTDDAQCTTGAKCNTATGFCIVEQEPEDPPIETDCTNFIDDDFDGRIDCEDLSACQGTPVCQAGASNVGAACLANTECKATGGDPLCFTEAQSGWPSGYCSEFCVPGMAGQCSGDGVCVTIGLASGNGVCYDGCSVNADCLPGYACDTAIPGVKACLPSCTDDTQCAMYCNADEGLCAEIPEDCANGIDDDFDFKTDCADLDCAMSCGASIQAACMAATAAMASNMGDTLGGMPVVGGSCTGNGGAEQIFTYTPGNMGETGVLTITLESATNQGIYVRTACTDAGTEMACQDNELGGTNEVLQVPVQGGQPLTIFVDSFEPGNEGPFTLGLSYQVAICGDGTLVSTEECDDGNTIPGDGCDANCQHEPAFYCQNPLVAQASNAGDTSSKKNVFSGTCVDGDGKEDVYVYTPAMNGMLTLTVNSFTDHGIYVRSTCTNAGTELACGNENSAPVPDSVTIPVMMGIPVYVFVDSTTAASAGPYTLDVSLVP
jgi:cysteine-rich repeat protein